MRARRIVQGIYRFGTVAASEVVHPRRGSNPARRSAARIAHPRRAEIFALPLFTDYSRQFLHREDRWRTGAVRTDVSSSALQSRIFDVVVW